MASQVRQIMLFRSISTIRIQELQSALSSSTQQFLSEPQRLELIEELGRRVPEWLCVKDLGGRGKIVKVNGAVSMFQVRQQLNLIIY
jgi:acyl-CoA synthetase (NDP forming)